MVLLVQHGQKLWRRLPIDKLLDRKAPSAIPIEFQCLRHATTARRTALLSRLAPNVVDCLVLGNCNQQPPELISIRNILKAAGCRPTANAAENALCQIFLVSDSLRRMSDPL